MLAVHFRSSNWILRYNATIVFDLDVEIGIQDNRGSEFEDAGEAIRPKPVLDVFADMRLQDDYFLAAGLAAAIDEVSYDVPDLGQVRVKWDGVAVWEKKAREAFWMCFRGSLQVGKFHAQWIYIPL